MYSQTFISSFNYGTSIIIVNSPNNMWIAADSRGNQRSPNSTSYFTECKIGKHKDIFYASAGRFTAFNSSKDGKEFRVFDVDKVLSEAITNSSSLDGAVLLARDEIYRSLSVLITSMKIDSKEIFKMFYGLIFKSALFTFEDGVNKLSTIQVTYNDDKLNVEVLNYIGDTGVLKLGFNENIIKFLNENPAFMSQNKSMKDKLIYLIQLEMKHHPLDIGEPIDILEINSENSYKWLTEYRNCFD